MRDAGPAGPPARNVSFVLITFNLLWPVLNRRKLHGIAGGALHGGRKQHGIPTSESTCAASDPTANRSKIHVCCADAIDSSPNANVNFYAANGVKYSFGNVRDMVVGLFSYLAAMLTLIDNCNNLDRKRRQLKFRFFASEFRNDIFLFKTRLMLDDGGEKLKFRLRIEVS